MLFVFRTLNFFALGVIFLTPFWLFNNTLDRLLPYASPVSSPRVDAMRDQVVTALSNLKNDIRADMCRREDAPLCVLSVCVPLTGRVGPESSRCR